MTDQKEYQRQYRIANKERLKQSRRSWYLKNRQRVYEINKRSVDRNRDHVNENARSRYWNLKIVILNHYGPDGEPKCSCCGESILEFLTIDHISGNGGYHRRQIRGGASRGGRNFYQWLKTNNFPTGYRVLCMNCNTSLGWFGYCPHGNVKIEKDYKHDERTLFDSFRVDLSLQ